MPSNDGRGTKEGYLSPKMEECVRVAVGVVTRKRPDALAVVLDSFSNMVRPDDAELYFIIVENDTFLRSEECVKRFAEVVSAPVIHELEPETGIPFARNRVLDIALGLNADYLTFVDDDEAVEQPWLVNLLCAVRERGLELAGGPLQVVAEGSELSKGQRAVLKHVQYRAAKRNRQGCKAVAAKRDNKILIFTNNWCLSLTAQRRYGVRFDELLRYTGGSDTRFSIAMREAGARIGWVPNAIVQDRIPTRRLTLRYHYARARDQATASVPLLGKGTANLLGSVFSRGVIGGVLMVLSPLAGRYWAAKGVFYLGTAIGRLRGMLRLKSAHYAASNRDWHGEA